MTQAVLDGLLDRAIAALPSGICEPTDSAPDSHVPDARRIDVGTAAEGATVKEGSYVLIDDGLMQVIDGVAVPVAVKSGKGTEGIFAKHARIIRGLIPVREALREVLRTGWHTEHSCARSGRST
jgi:N12 class adenine-specific DNA methylase